MRYFLFLFFICFYSLSSESFIFLKNKAVTNTEKIKISDISYYHFGLEDKEVFQSKTPFRITKSQLEKKINQKVTIVGDNTLVIPLLSRLANRKVELKALEVLKKNLLDQANIKLRMIGTENILTSQGVELDWNYLFQNKQNQFFFKLTYSLNRKKIHSSFHRFELLKKQVIAFSNKKIYKGELFNNSFINLKEIFLNNQELENVYFLEKFQYIARKDIENGKILKRKDILSESYLKQKLKKSDSLLLNNVFYFYYPQLAKAKF